MISSQRAILTATQIPPSTETYTPTPFYTPTASPTPTATPIVILDPEPMELSIQSEDGTELTGLYYPASANPAPLIVLVHWTRGDQTEYTEIAHWLQGRGLLKPTPNYNKNWKSSDRFPERTFDLPLGVLTFNLRECYQDGCGTYLPVEWLSDIRAVMEKAVSLGGVDRDQIITAGASIGADGALYGCSWLNQSGVGSCQGSFLLSPSSLLTLPFEEVAGQILDLNPALPIYCLYGLRDDASVETCSAVPGLTLVDYGYIDNHGLELFQYEREPYPLIVLGEFITTALDGE